MPSKTVTTHEVETQLAALLERVKRGEEIVIEKDHKPLARLVAIAPPSKRPRSFGQHKGMARMSPDFDTALPPAFWLDGSTT